MLDVTISHASKNTTRNSVPSLKPETEVFSAITFGSLLKISIKIYLNILWHYIKTISIYNDNMFKNNQNSVLCRLDFFRVQEVFMSNAVLEYDWWTSRGNEFAWFGNIFNLSASIYLLLIGTVPELGIKSIKIDCEIFCSN